MEKQMDPTYQVVVQNRVKANYRCAGFSLAPGVNTLANVSASQLAQLKGDSRLVVQITETPSGEKGVEGLSDHVAGGEQSEPVRENSLPADLSKLTVAQLKQLLTEKGVAFNGNATKAELMALLVPADDEPVNSGERE